MAKKFPDLTGDGKVTMKDVLKGRGVVKKSRGGGVQGPPASAPAAPSGGGYDRNRLPVLGAPPTAQRTAPGVSIAPSLRGGMPGFKLKKSFAGGGKVTSGDGICKKGHTKGKMV